MEMVTLMIDRLRQPKRGCRTSRWARRLWTTLLPRRPVDTTCNAVNSKEVCSTFEETYVGLDRDPNVTISNCGAITGERAMISRAFG